MGVPISKTPTKMKVPNCPNCSDEMVKRDRKDGSGWFWGCSNFPECKAIIDPKK